MIKNSKQIKLDDDAQEDEARRRPARPEVSVSALRIIERNASAGQQALEGSISKSYLLGSRLWSGAGKVCDTHRPTCVNASLAFAHVKTSAGSALSSG